MQEHFSFKIISLLTRGNVHCGTNLENPEVLLRVFNTIDVNPAGITKVSKIVLWNLYLRVRKSETYGQLVNNFLNVLKLCFSGEEFGDVGYQG